MDNKNKKNTKKNYYKNNKGSKNSSFYRDNKYNKKNNIKNDKNNIKENNNEEIKDNIKIEPVIEQNVEIKEEVVPIKKEKSSKNIPHSLLILFLIILAFSLIGLGIYLSIDRDTKVILKRDKVVFLEDIWVSELIDKIENGYLVKDKLIDTSKVGDYYIEIVTKKDKESEEIKTIKKKISIVDSIPPEINGEDTITVDIDDPDNLKSKFEVKDNYYTGLSYNIEGDYDLSVAGEYNLKVVATDYSENTTIKEFKLIVKEVGFKTSKGFRFKYIDGIPTVDGIIIANKSYPLPSSYNPGLSPTAKIAFDNLVGGARSAGYNIYLVSGFRSYSSQYSIYNNYVARDGRALADTYSARPGYSEHQTGLAIDVNNLVREFGNYPEGKWLANNCQHYGFIIRYPNGKDNITGYMYEPWHIRYVGKELAEKLYNNGNWITLEEYFGIDSYYH